MTNVKAFLAGIVLIGTGVYFGDPVPREFSVGKPYAVEFTENKCMKNKEFYWNHDYNAHVPPYTDMFVRQCSVKSP